MKRKGLGRGLDALMPEIFEEEEAQAADAPGERVVLVNVGDIDPNPRQPRRRFDQATLKELADSIRQVGLLQPILLYPEGGRYRIIAGERRWRAARMAELAAIPAIVRDMDEVRRQEAALIENLQREDLNPIEEALAVRALMEDCGLTQEAAAQRLGRSRPALANLLRLLSLPDSVIELVREGRLSAGHARVLAGMDDERRAEALAQRAVAEGWSVRQMEIAAQSAQIIIEKMPGKAAKIRVPEFNELEDRLRKTFGLRAQVMGTLDKGKITLQYGSREELERLYEMIGEQTHA